MQVYPTFKLLAVKQVSSLWTSNVHLAAVACVGKEWRLNNKLNFHGRENHPIVDEKDYSFVDGRPTPLNPAKKRRALLQIDICKKIIAATKLVDDIVKEHTDTVNAASQERRRKLERKLKPKGDLIANK